MLKLNELKQGDMVYLNDEGIEREGTVVRVSHEQHEALVNNGIQEFWFHPDEMRPIPLNDNWLTRLGFSREDLPDGSAKYKRDSFRLVLPQKENFGHVDMWWREDRRHFGKHLGVHELQNLHLDMTKVPLEMPLEMP